METETRRVHNIPKASGMYVRPGFLSRMGVRCDPENDVTDRKGLVQSGRVVWEITTTTVGTW